MNQSITLVFVLFLGSTAALATDEKAIHEQHENSSGPHLLFGSGSVSLQVSDKL
jgi:hypothetical protein